MREDVKAKEFYLKIHLRLCNNSKPMTQINFQASNNSYSTNMSKIRNNALEELNQ